ncbi:O-methyltransferase [Raineyella sp. W15-4]|uniref:O-methyltransferase n=1 Tax=Raineyella sp. W15-4 TaxID=3081651 RepID=UPI002955DE6D|nr:O-methyltransferase [Raineyella sp. W15-4]WOQ15953.1 O-methyltransferase [Raineyella sp. W15-4]
MTTRKTTQKAAAPGPAAKKSASSDRMHDIFAPTAPETPPVIGPAEPPAPADPRSDTGAPALGPDEATWAYAEGFRRERPEAARAREAAEQLDSMPVSPGVATVLTLLARAARARSVVEIGSGTGVSGLALYAGMVPEGVLTSIDADSEVQRVARRMFRDAGVPSNRIRLIAGDALTVMPKLSDAAYDLVFVDGDMLDCGEYIEQAQRLLRPDGVLVVNNALWYNLVADPQNEDNETIVIREALEGVAAMEDVWVPALLPVGNGLLVASRRAS